MKVDFEAFWKYVSPHFAGRFLDQWCERALRTRIEPIKQVARMLLNHKELILNWFRAKKQFSSGVVEGLNNKAKSITKRAYGFRTQKCLEVALFHNLGNLPEPSFPHKFF
jgi:transposase